MHHAWEVIRDYVDALTAIQGFGSLGFRGFIGATPKGGTGSYIRTATKGGIRTNGPIEAARNGGKNDEIEYIDFFIAIFFKDSKEIIPKWCNWIVPGVLDRGIDRDKLRAGYRQLNSVFIVYL